VLEETGAADNIKVAFNILKEVRVNSRKLTVAGYQSQRATTRQIK
jgi:flavoprotein